jgi:calcineurin-like phosphoesterase family protein
MNTTEDPVEKSRRTRQASREAGVNRAVQLANTWIDEAKTGAGAPAAAVAVTPPNLRQRSPQVWYTGDPHLGHERIIELCERPFGSVREMNDAILDRINSVVARQDMLVILGDVLLGTFEESVQLLSRIRAGRVRLFPGNHDRWSLAYGHRGSPEVVKNKRRMWMADYERAGGRRGSRRGAGGDDSTGIMCVPDRAPSVWSTQIGGQPVLLSHYPYLGSGDSRVDRPDRYEWLRPVDAGLPLIHGHVHTRWKVRGRMFNVGVDVNDFTPVAEEELRDWLGSLGSGVIGQNAANRDR